METIAVYSRKSKFTGKGESIGNQVELCRDYIRLHYGEEAAEQAIVYEDEGFSGKNLNRPDFKRMMQAAKSRKIRAIVVYRLDRISRNISDFSALIEELSRLGIDFVSIREQFDTATPMGRAMMYIASVFSQLERETIAERIRDNMRELAKTGRWLGGITPTGYTSESVSRMTVDGKSRKVCKLKLLPDEADTVKLIYTLFLQGGSLTCTEAELMRRKVVSKNGNFYTRFTIKSILQNPVYLIADDEAYAYLTEHQAELFCDRAEFDGVHGIMAYHRTDQQKGRTTRCLPMQEWIVSVGAHPGLISGRQWGMVQELLERNRSRSYRQPRSNEALLTGMIYCSCGSRMYPKLTDRKAADGRAIYTYLCKQKERSRGSLCKGKNVRGNALDAAVLEELKKIPVPKELLCAALLRNRGDCVGAQDDCGAQRSRLLAEQTQTQRKIDALVDSLADIPTGAARESVAKRVEELCAARDALAAQLAQLDLDGAQTVLGAQELEEKAAQLASPKQLLAQMDVEGRRALVRALVRRVVWDGTCAQVVLLGAQEEEGGDPPI